MAARTPHQLGVFENKDDVFDSIAPRQMWSYQLKENGYFCSSGGKVHHYYRPLRWRYHQVLYSDHQKRWRADMKMPPGMPIKEYGGHRRGLATTDPADDQVYYDHNAANDAIEFLTSYDGADSFYREVGFFSPHGPHITPARFKDIYDHRAFVMPSEWANGFDDTNYADQHLRANAQSHTLDWWQKSVRNYFSALSHADYHFGRILKALEASRHAQNTLIVLLSDHGFHLGSRGRFKKTTLWEDVAGVPLVVHDPDRVTKNVVHDPVALLDVGRTILDYAGVEPRKRHMGQSLRPLVEGRECAKRVIPTFHHGNVGARVGKHRIIRYVDGSTELFDLEQDPWQLRNIATGHPELATLTEALFSAARAYGYDPEQGRAVQAKPPSLSNFAT